MQSSSRRLHLSFLFCLVSLLLSRMGVGQELSWWSAPEPLTELNTQYHDKSLFLSFDGLTVYWAQEDGPGWHYSRLYRATRARVAEPFGAPEEISTLNNSAGHVTSPWVSPDNLRMYYYCTGYGAQLRLSERASTDQEWSPGASISELNRLGRIATPSLTEDELTLVFEGRYLTGGLGDWDIWLARRSDRHAAFDDVVNLTALNSEAADMHPHITPDGLMLYFMSWCQGRPKIYRAHRASRADAFGSLTHMALFDFPDANSAFPYMTPDYQTFYFSVYPEGGSVDNYVSHALGDYCVDGDGGSDLANGLNPQMALATVQRAIDRAQDGDTICVAPGVYEEELIFAGKAVTVQSYGDAAVLTAPDRFAVSFYRGEGPDSVLRNFVIADSYVGLFISNASPTITNVTVVGNTYGVEAYRDAAPAISNSIFWDNTESDLYHCLANYSCLERYSEGEGNLSADPLFVDPDQGDYHLRSERGRYWPAHEVWVLDAVTSPCIDAGDPAADYAAERVPNGGRLNMGAYGGTAWAGMSESPLAADFNGDRTVDANDLEQFTDAWEQEVDPTTWVRTR